MSGLDPEKERILEIALVVTNGDLEIIEHGPVVVIHQPDDLVPGLIHDGSHRNLSFSPFVVPPVHAAVWTAVWSRTAGRHTGVRN